ncbi:MAG: DNA polymerase III subunit gamma/tau [Clostridia bacterium]
MSYLALYRKFRPTTFDEVVGQEHISTTLRNQITQGRISHAYLFCGSRGTGKTSLAKLFAKAVNCENPIDGNPCGKCPTCLALSQPDNMDIVEIDAASNNSVDDLRDLRDKVQFQPVSAKYKVYIIDEVHMLTINAFNALLKTLEEPPKHVIFILATTEVHKIPATILSRCMRFDFKLISLEKIFSHIKFVYSQIGKEAEDEALYAIAKAGDGSMRDALSIAEICLSLTNGKLTFLQVNEIIGNLSRDKLESLFEAIVSKNQKEVLNFVDDYIKSGKSVSVITRDIFQFFRDILVLKVANADTLTLPKDVLDRMKTLAQKVDNSFLIRALDIFAELEPKYKLSQNPKILLEIALIKLTNLQSDLSISALARRVIALEAKLNELQTHREIQPVPMAKKTLEDELIEKLENTKPQTEQIPPEENIDDNDDDDEVEEYSLEEAQNIAERHFATMNLDEKTPEIQSQNISGLILKELRKNFNPSLISLVGISTVTTDGKTVSILANSKTSLEFLSRAENKAELLKIVNDLGFSDLTLSIVKVQDDETKKIIDNAKTLLGDMLEIKNIEGKL